MIKHALSDHFDRGRNPGFKKSKTKIKYGFEIAASQRLE